MSDIEKYSTFVKSQAEFHERQAKRFIGNEKRETLHGGTAETFRELLLFLENVDQKIPAVAKKSGLTLGWNELEDLPPELMAELSITESDKLDFSIAELIQKCGGIATLDRILVEIYRLTGEVLKRQNLNARLYRMVQKEMIFSVPGKKGVYSSRPIPEEEAKELN